MTGKVLVRPGRSGVDWPVQARRVVRRQRVFLVVAVVAAVVAGGGLVASTWVRSPAQQAAEQSPPAASVVTAPVTSQVLTATVAVRGTVTAGAQVAVTGPVAAASGSVLTVTGVHKAVGDQVSAGEVVAEVSGRPVVVLHGAVPAYRTLTPGATGVDVTQLQGALSELGYGHGGDAAGTFGAGTQKAVAALFTARGYQAATTTDTDGAAEASSLAGAQDTQRSADKAVRDARTALATAGADTQAAAQQALDDALADQKAAAATLAAVKARIGVTVPLGEVVFAPTLPATVGSVGASVGTVLGASTTSVMTLLTGTPVVTATLPEGQQQLVSTGQTVTIADDVHNRTATGTVAGVGAYTAGASTSTTSGSSGGTTGSGTGGYPVTVTPTGGVDASWLGADVLVRIATASTGTAVLTVPVSAVVTRADGTTLVQVLHSGTRTDMPVTTGATADGTVEVSGDGLHAGDSVVVSTS